MIEAKVSHAKTWKYRCDECGWRGEEKQFLRAPNPFKPRSEVFGCPVCKTIGEFVNVCDEPGCKNDAGCGWPSDGIYRRTCYDHWVY